MNCPHCDHENREEADFCRGCGRALSSARSEMPSDHPVVDSERIALIVILLAANTFVFFFGSRFDLWRSTAVFTVMTVYDAALLIALAASLGQSSLRKVAIVVAAVTLVFRFMLVLGWLNFLF